MKKLLASLVLSAGLSVPSTSQAQFSTDAPILLEILANNVSQLYEMYEIVQTGNERLQIMRNLSQGLETALSTYNDMRPPTDPGQYKNWKTIGDSLNKIKKIYGSVANTRESSVQTEIDRGIAEAISRNNKVYDFAKKSDQIGRKIRQKSNLTNSKGAQRLTAQSIGVLIQVQNQATRTQASQLKLSAQALARENHKDKEYARRISEDSKTLTSALKSTHTSFTTPRF